MLDNSMSVFRDCLAAIAEYKKAVALDPTSVMAFYNLASAAHALNQHDLAKQYFAKTILLDPHYADAHFNLGIVHQERGRLEEALRCYDEAARLDSTLADAAAAADFVRRALKDDAKRKGANKEP